MVVINTTGNALSADPDDLQPACDHLQKRCKLSGRVARRGPRIPFKFDHGSDTVVHGVSKTKVYGEAPASNRKEVMQMSDTIKQKTAQPNRKPRS